MNQNVSESQEDTDITPNYNETHKSFKNKSTWRPNLTNKTLDTFKRAFKMNLLESKIEKNNT